MATPSSSATSTFLSGEHTYASDMAVVTSDARFCAWTKSSIGGGPGGGGGGGNNDVASRHRPSPLASGGVFGSETQLNPSQHLLPTVTYGEPEAYAVKHLWSSVPHW